MKRVRGGSDSPGDELAKRAVVFLVDSRTAWVTVVFYVRTDRRNDRAARGGGVDNADDARQSCLHERGGENPSTDKSRNASIHSVVSCDRAARTM